METKVFKDVKKFSVTSTLKKSDIELVKKSNPNALLIKDEDGNDIFGVSYVPGKSSIGARGVTFGEVNDGGYLLVVGDIPEKVENFTEYVADVVGGAVEHLQAIEAKVPAIVAEITETRNTLVNSIVVA